MPVGVHGHDNRGMSKSLLHDLGRQALPAAIHRVDAPGRIEVTQRVQAGVFRVTVGVGELQVTPAGVEGIDRQVAGRLLGADGDGQIEGRCGADKGKRNN